MYINRQIIINSRNAKFEDISLSDKGICYIYNYVIINTNINYIYYNMKNYNIILYKKPQASVMRISG